MMDDMLRGELQAQRSGVGQRRRGMVRVGAEPESAATDAADRASMTVLAPGEPDDPARFSYEPFSGADGAWIVYPPGVPCPATEARVSKDGPANADDFPEMQQLLDDAPTATDAPLAMPAKGAYR